MYKELSSLVPQKLPLVTQMLNSPHDGTWGYVYAIDQEALAVLRHDAAKRAHLEAMSQNAGVSSNYSRVLRRDALFYPPPRDNPHFQPDADWNLPPDRLQTVVKAS